MFTDFRERGMERERETSMWGCKGEREALITSPHKLLEDGAMFKPAELPGQGCICSALSLVANSETHISRLSKKGCSPCFLFGTESQNALLSRETMQYRSSFREKHNNTEKKHAGFSFYILQWFAQFLFGWLHQVVLFLKNSNRLKKKNSAKKNCFREEEWERQGGIWLASYIICFFRAQWQLLELCWLQHLKDYKAIKAVFITQN